MLTSQLPKLTLTTTRSEHKEPATGYWGKGEAHRALGFSCASWGDPRTRLSQKLMGGLLDGVYNSK